MDHAENKRRAAHWAYVALAYLAIGLALLGVVLPGIPTVPFLLVAAWAASRGSERLHDWLHNHRHFGHLLRHWSQQRAIPSRAKWTGVLLLMVSWVLLNWGRSDLLVPVLTGLLFGMVALFLLTRPAPAEVVEDPAAD